jgi:uncharacterized delta-60 repeat protein
VSDAFDSATSLQVGLDPSFGSGGVVDGELSEWTPVGVAVDSQDRVLVSGPEDPILTPASETLRRLTPEGAIDATFGVAGTVALGLVPELSKQALRSLPDGRIGVLGGLSDPQTETAFAARLGADGTLDPMFAEQPLLTTAEGPFSGGIWQDDASYFVFGALAVVRYDASGKVVADYGVGGAVAPATAGRVDPDGRLWTVAARRVFRYLASGALDPGFGESGCSDVSMLSGGSSDLDLHDVLLGQAGGATVVGSHPSGGTYYVDVARLTASGSLDTAYATAGLISVEVDGGPVWATELADGRLLVVTSYGDLLVISIGGTLQERRDLAVQGTVLAATIDAYQRLAVVGASTSAPMFSKWFVRRYLLF